jgi:hypothetical protein
VSTGCIRDRCICGCCAVAAGDGAGRVVRLHIARCGAVARRSGLVVARRRRRIGAHGGVGDLRVLRNRGAGVGGVRGRVGSHCGVGAGARSGGLAAGAGVGWVGGRGLHRIGSGLVGRGGRRSSSPFAFRRRASSSPCDTAEAAKIDASPRRPAPGKRSASRPFANPQERTRGTANAWCARLGPRLPSSSTPTRGRLPRRTGPSASAGTT